jgi:hypothetical protein
LEILGDNFEKALSNGREIPLMPFLFFYLDFDYFFLIFVSGNYYSELDGSSGRGFACKIWTS